jgi:glycosyltransferase involved in cell wall biosynthesis
VAFDLAEHRFTAQKAALYARPNDELDFARRLAQLMDDPKQRQQMGQAGRERVERELAWSHQAPCLLEVYEKVLGKPRSQLRQKLSQQ